MLRTAIVLMHPAAPEGTEMVCEYLGFGKAFWDWSRILDTVYDFMEIPKEHELKTLEPRVDFFKKHPSQLK
ncbi:MAG: methionine--tRNA ligase, partial [Clostridia bacterium]|nr:methionine--tRNA ligase [Clostridia bacterium]